MRFYCNDQFCVTTQDLDHGDFHMIWTIQKIIHTINGNLSLEN